MKHVTIPARWNGREALNFVSFLNRIIEAIWRAHGRRWLTCSTSGGASGSIIPDDDLPL